MAKSKIFSIVDKVAFMCLVFITAWSFSNKSVAAKIDSLVLPEEINRGFHGVINYGSKKIEDEASETGGSYYRYGFLKGALDGEIVTQDDWKILLNTIKYQMQEDAAVLDFQDGTGIVVSKSKYLSGTYGKLQGTEITDEVKILNISDYSEVLNTIKEDGYTENKKLQDIVDIYSYFKALDNKDYTVLIAVSDEGASSFNCKMAEILAKLGARTNLSEYTEEDVWAKKYYRYSYYAVLSQGEQLDEKASAEKITTTGKLSDGTEYQIESAGFDTNESKASIVINGQEYAVNQRGMNIVVYDNEKHEVVDSVCFDTCDGLSCSRLGSRA